MLGRYISKNPGAAPPTPLGGVDPSPVPPLPGVPVVVELPPVSLRFGVVGSGMLTPLLLVVLLSLLVLLLAVPLLFVEIEAEGVVVPATVAEAVLLLEVEVLLALLPPLAAAAAPLAAPPPGTMSMKTLPNLMIWSLGFNSCNSISGVPSFSASLN